MPSIAGHARCHRSRATHGAIVRGSRTLSIAVPGLSPSHRPLLLLLVVVVVVVGGVVVVFPICTGLRLAEAILSLTTPKLRLTKKRRYIYIYIYTYTLRSHFGSRPHYLVNPSGITLGGAGLGFDRGHTGSKTQKREGGPCWAHRHFAPGSICSVLVSRPRPLVLMGGQRFHRGQSWDWGGGARGGYWSGDDDWYRTRQQTGKPYLVCKGCEGWCFEWRAKRNAFKCVCGEDFHLSPAATAAAAKAAAAKATTMGTSTGADKDDEEKAEDDKGPATFTFAMLEYFAKVIKAAQDKGGSVVENDLHASAMAWVENAATRAKAAQAELEKCPSLQEALKEEKKATAARAVLARRVQQHTNKIKEHEKLLAMEKDSLAKARTEEEEAQAHLEQARGKVRQAQEAIKRIEDQALDEDMGADEDKAANEIAKMQEQIDQSDKARQMLVDEVEKRKASLQKDIEGLAAKRTRFSAAAKAKADAKEAASAAAAAPAAPAAAAAGQQRPAAQGPAGSDEAREAEGQQG